MKALKSALWILPLFFTFSAMADEYVGSSGKGGNSGAAPARTRAVASEPNPALEIHQCEIVSETVGGFLSMAIFGSSSSQRVAGTKTYEGLERNARRSCKNALKSTKHKCSCATFASLGIQPTPEQIAKYLPKKGNSERTELAATKTATIDGARNE